MSDCKDKKCKDCNEDYLQGMLPCVTLPELCVDGEKCEETYNANCVRYTGNAVVCGTTIVLSTGMTTQEALISLANAICLSGGGGLVDLTALEQCCATNTSNITNLQTNLSIVNNTLTTISTQISTINTQITALQECCDNSLKMCTTSEFPFSYAAIGCQTVDNQETVNGQDFFYIDKYSAGLSHESYSKITGPSPYGNRLQLPPQATASAFYIEASADYFGLHWNPALPNSEYYKSIQAVLGVTPTPYSQTDLLLKTIDKIIGTQGVAGSLPWKDKHINDPNPINNPLLMTAIGVQGVASLSNVLNIGGDFLSLWRNFQSAPNTAIRGKANGSDLNSGFDIEVGLATDTNRTNIGGKIVVKSGTGGINHGLKIDVTQAQGTTYAVQLKDTTAAAGKFLKAIDSDGNAIWDTITTTSVPPGVVSNNNINGTTNYLTKWIDVDKIGDSLIQDDGDAIGIGVTPSINIKFKIKTTKTYGFEVEQTKTLGVNFAQIGISNGVGADSNTGLYGQASGANESNVGIYGEATGNNGDKIGVFALASGIGNKYCAMLQDGTQGIGKFLKSVTTDGRANWSTINISDVTNGLSSTLLGVPNGIATLDNNSKLLMSQMPISVMDYKGTYDIVTNTPVLADGTGNQGDVYVATTAGTRTFGAGNTITVGVGDWLIYNGTKWEKTLGNNVGAGTVTSVGLTVGTTGSDINISNSPITTSGAIALNIPTASASARGVLSISDWLLFNSKVSATGGTTNYLAKFTPNGSTIGNSKIFDDGTSISIGIGAATFANTVFYVQGTTGQSIGGNFVNNSAGTGLGYGLIGTSTQASGTNVGVQGRAQTSNTGTNIGISGIATNGAVNHAAQLQDGTETSTGGKFLKDMGDGKTNWNYLPDSAQIMCSDMTSIITADASNLKAYWAAPCNGKLTDAFASLRVPQSGGSVFTVLVKTSGITIATLTFANGTFQFMSTNPTVTQTFTKGDIFELYVSQVGDGSARSLLVTLNYLRT